MLPMLLMAAGGLYSGLSSYYEGKNANRLGKYNQAVKEQEAKAIEAKTGFDLMRAADESAQIQSTMEANIGQSGAVSSLGSPLLAQAIQFAESELRNLMIGYEGSVSAQRTRQEGLGYKMEGRMARQRGRQALLGSFIGAAGTAAAAMYKPKVPTSTTGQTSNYVPYTKANDMWTSNYSKSMNQWSKYR